MGKNIFKLGIILLLICGISTALLAVINNITQPIIKENTQKQQEEAKADVLPNAKTFEKVDDKLYKGLNNNETVGFTVNVSPKGYGGEINMIVGLNKDFSVAGIKITELSETPGLGAKADNLDFLSQFINKKEDIKVVKVSAKHDNEVVAISGATITSNAIVTGIKEAISYAKKNGGAI